MYTVHRSNVDDRIKGSNTIYIVHYYIVHGTNMQIIKSAKKNERIIFFFFLLLLVFLCHSVSS